MRRGRLDDSTGEGVDGHTVDVQLSTSLGVTVWAGSTTTANGYFTTYVPVPATAAPGMYTLMALAEAQPLAPARSSRSSRPPASFLKSLF